MQAGHCAGAIFSMQRRKYFVTAERAVDCGVGAICVADLGDHDDIRVTPHYRSQNSSESQRSLWIDLDLHRSVEMFLDRLLDRVNLLVAVTKIVKHRIKRGCFSTGRLSACDEHTPVHLTKPTQYSEFPWLKTKFAQERLSRPKDSANDGIFVPRRNCNEAKVVPDSVVGTSHRSILDQAFLIVFHPAQHLDAFNDELVMRRGDRRLRNKIFVDSESH